MDNGWNGKHETKEDKQDTSSNFLHKPSMEEAKKLPARFYSKSCRNRVLHTCTPERASRCSGAPDQNKTTWTTARDV